MEHPSSNTLKRLFSVLGRQDKEEIHRTLQAFASDLRIRVDADNLYLTEKSFENPIPLTDIHCILITNGCFYIQFRFDENGILVLGLRTNQRDVICLQQSGHRFRKVYGELLYRVRLAKRGLKYFYIKLRRRSG